MRDVTPVPPLALVLLCGGHLTCEDKNDGRGWATLAVDGWLRLQVPTSAAPVLLDARKRVNALVQSLVATAAAAGASTASGSHRASILARLGDVPSQGSNSDGLNGQESAMELEAVAEAGLLTALELLVKLPVLPETPFVPLPKAKPGGGANKNAKKRANKKSNSSSSSLGYGGKGGGKGCGYGGKGSGGSGIRRHHGTIVGPDVSSIWGGYAKDSGHDW